MSREVCGICWCPYDEETGECACAPQGPTPPYEAKTEAEITAYCAGWWDALQKARNAIDASKQKPLTEKEIDRIWDSEKAFADIYAIVRAIERAHGIDGAPEERNFCPRCGRKLTQELITEDEDD